MRWYCLLCLMSLLSMVLLAVGCNESPYPPVQPAVPPNTTQPRLPVVSNPYTGIPAAPPTTSPKPTTTPPSTSTPLPNITGLSPDRAARGDHVMISGSNFGKTKSTKSRVTLGGKDALIVAWASNTITFEVPADAAKGQLPVVVFTGDLNEYKSNTMPLIIVEYQSKTTPPTTSTTTTPTMASLQKSKFSIQVTLYGKWTVTQVAKGQTAARVLSALGNNGYISFTSGALQWNGASFSYDYDGSEPFSIHPLLGSSTETTKVQGTVSADAKTMTQMVLKHSYAESQIDSGEMSFTLVNVPLQWESKQVANSVVTTVIKGAGLSRYMTKVNLTRTAWGPFDPNAVSMQVELGTGTLTPDWANTANTIKIDFVK